MDVQAVVSIRISQGKLDLAEHDQAFVRHLLKQSGVYRIRRVDADFVYYGSSFVKRGLRYRFLKHLSELRRGVHCNQLLQNHWNKYGESVFLLEIVEICLPEQCRQRESFYLKQRGIGIENGTYNFCEVTEPWEAINHHLMRQRALSSQCKKYVLVSPLGETQLVTNLSEFARERGLCASALAGVAKGRARHCKGWRCQLLNDKNLKLAAEPFPYKPRGGPYLMISPSNEEYVVKNLEEFCRQNNLTAKSMRNVASGKTLKHRGWRCSYLGRSDEVNKICFFSEHAIERLRNASKGRTITDEHKRKIAKANSFRRYSIRHPDGCEEQVSNLTQFCRENLLNPSLMVAVAKGKRSHHKGFLCQYID